MGDISGNHGEGKESENPTKENDTLQLTSRQQMDSTRHVNDALFQSHQHPNSQDDKPASQQKENVAVETGIQNMGIEEDSRNTQSNNIVSSISAEDPE